MPQSFSQSDAVNGLKWWGADTNIVLTGALQVKLASPMVYIFNAAGGARSDEPGAIDVRLPISGDENNSGAGELGYWPRYDGLNPGQRRYYLSWIAQRRMSMPSELGYVFLFIYGLERRALADQADQEVIFREVVRLRQLYNSSGRLRSHSFESYTSAFLWFLLIQRPRAFALDEVRFLLQQPLMWSEQTLASALYWFAVRNQPLPTWAAMRIAPSLGGAWSSSVPTRVAKEFEQLFCVRYARRFPDGLRPCVSHSQRTYIYRPASAALRPTQIVVPDALSDPLDYAPLREIWNECISELHKLSVVAARNGDAVNTAEGWEVMPVELRRGKLHPLTDTFCQILAPHSSASGITVVFAADMEPLIEAEGSSKLTPPQCRKISQIASHIGYSIEPDPVITHRAWKLDQPIAIFLQVFDDRVDFSRYPAAACMLQIGFAVLSAGGTVTEDNHATLIDQIAKLFEVNQSERRRLEAVGVLLANTGADLSTVTRIVKGLPATQREKMAKLTLALASSDDAITTAELRIIRRVYISLGFAADEIERAINGLKRDDEPTTVVRRGTRSPGERIPAASKPSTQVLQLDRAAIAEIIRDTDDVSQMLASAMGASADGQSVSEPIPPESHDLRDKLAATTATIISADTITTTHQSVSLPERYTELFNSLIARSEWSLSDAEMLARNYGLMLSGAVEAINDWSVEVYGGPLFVEESDRLLVETTLLQ